MNEFSKVRVGVIGLGNIGHHHADRLLDIGGSLAGGMDIQPAARERFSEKYGVPSYEDHETLFEDCQAVVVTTPNRFHEEYAVSALEAGLDVLLEKPLAHTVESAERIAEVAREAESFCMVGFNNRFANPVRVLKERQYDGEFGEVYHVEANYVRRRGIPGRGSWFTSKDIAGGGSLIDIGVHAIDLSLYFLDFPAVVEVMGVTRSEFGPRDDYAYLEMWGEDTGGDEFDVDDSASAFIRCAGGRSISLEVAWATNRPTNDEFVIRGSEASAVFDRAAGSLDIHAASNAGSDHFTDTTVRTQQSDPHGTEQEVFLQAILQDEVPEINTVDQGLTVQRVIDGIYRSSETGRAIRIDEQADDHPVTVD